MPQLKKLAVPLTLALASLALADKPAKGPATVGGNFGQQAAEFPPGDFSDGGHYSLSDFQGKILVLFFYEDSCPRCRGEIPLRNKVVAAFKGKPVKFIAIGPHDTLNDVHDYITGTGLAMTTFADPYGVMQKRYGFSISLQNIYQFRVIGPDGIIRGYEMTEDAINKAIADIKWTYKDENFNPKLNGAVEAFEWNQWVMGAKLLKPHLTSSDKAEKESAEKLFAEIKTKGEQWKQDADAAADTDPVKAYDLYTRISLVFDGDPLAKSVADPLKKLKTNKDVLAELDARRAYAQLDNALALATPQQKDAVVGFCKSFTKKYENTPTAAKVQAYLDDLTAAK